MGLMWPCKDIVTMRMLMFGFSPTSDMVNGWTREDKYYVAIVYFFLLNVVIVLRDGMEINTDAWM
jgi:hypothetical protein